MVGGEEGTLGSWGRRARAGRGEDDELGESDGKEWRRLHKEVVGLEMQREVLKRSVVRVCHERGGGSV